MVWDTKKFLLNADTPEHLQAWLRGCKETSDGRRCFYLERGSSRWPFSIRPAKTEDLPSFLRPKVCWAACPPLNLQKPKLHSWGQPAAAQYPSTTPPTPPHPRPRSRRS